MSPSTAKLEEVSLLFSSIEKNLWKQSDPCGGLLAVPQLFFFNGIDRLNKNM
jgi:hypothetical protein